jgi:predicted nucleotidyltransferase component of viral defense system
MSQKMTGHQIMQRIKKIARNVPGGTVNELRIIFALERAVSRLETHSRLSDHLIFKGGFVLLKTIETNRFTRDLDALAYEISKKDIPELVKNALCVDLNDGVWFGDIIVEDLKDQGLYGGLRFDCAYQIGDPPPAEKIRKLSRVHIDVGFGDEMDSAPSRKKMSSIVYEVESISWLVYPLETIFAEKLETLFSRGSLNSRAKDVYDLQLNFTKTQDKKALFSAIHTTFQHRNTPVPASFYEIASRFDLVTLRTSWAGVQLTETSTKFNQVWDSLLEILKVLDGTVDPEINSIPRK